MIFICNIFGVKQKIYKVIKSSIISKKERKKVAVICIQNIDSTVIAAGRKGQKLHFH